MKPLALFLGVVFLLPTPAGSALGQEPTPVPRSSKEECLTNGDVLKMLKAKLSDELVLAKIKSSQCCFDVGVDAILKLKESGVSEQIIAGMMEADATKRAPRQAERDVIQNPPTLEEIGAKAERERQAEIARKRSTSDAHDPLTWHAPGLYLFHDNQLTALQGVDAVRVGPSTWGEAVRKQGLSGAGKDIYYELAGGRASLRVTSAKPIFYLYLRDTSLQSPHPIPSMEARLQGAVAREEEFWLENFALVALQSDNRRRWLPLSGVHGLTAVEWTIERVLPSVYRITPRAPLPLGEYAFFDLLENAKRYCSTGGTEDTIGGKRENPVIETTRLVCDFGLDPGGNSPGSAVVRVAPEVERLAATGLAAYAEGRYLDATTLLQQAIGAGATDPPVFAAAGAGLFHLGEFARAKELAMRAIQAGGVAFFPVRHNHFSLIRPELATGNLKISQAGLAFQGEQCNHTFDLVLWSQVSNFGVLVNPFLHVELAEGSNTTKRYDFADVYSRYEYLARGTQLTNRTDASAALRMILGVIQWAKSYRPETPTAGGEFAFSEPASGTGPPPTSRLKDSGYAIPRRR